MMWRYGTKAMVRCVVMAVGIVAGVCGLSPEGRAQNFTTDVTITTGNAPAVLLQQDNSQALGVQNWAVTGDETGWYLDELTGNQTPLSIFKGAPDNSVVVASTGNVGIGTATPSAKLHVSSAATGDAFIGMGLTPGAAGTCAMNAGYAGSSFGPGIGFFNVRPCAQGTPDLRFMVANVVKLTVDSTGINVAGTIRANGTPLNVPDYVFAPEYKLMPLGELATYIKEERHLPSIPSATELQRTGLDLGSMQMKLLEKVEELTLYTIKQEERAVEQTEQVQGLRAQNQELAQENARLQERLTALEAMVKALAQR